MNLKDLETVRTHNNKLCEVREIIRKISNSDCPYFHVTVNSTGDPILLPASISSIVQSAMLDIFIKWEDKIIKDLNDLGVHVEDAQ